MCKQIVEYLHHEILLDKEILLNKERRNLFYMLQHEWNSKTC